MANHFTVLDERLFSRLSNARVRCHYCGGEFKLGEKVFFQIVRRGSRKFHPKCYGSWGIDI